MRLALAFLLLSGLACSAPHGTAALHSHWPETIAKEHRLDPLRVIPSSEHQCGASALWMALDYLGIETSLDELEHEVYTPSKEGAFAFDVTTAAVRRAAIAYPLGDSLDKLLIETNNDHPVIVLLNLGLEAAPLWHFALVTGYSSDEITVTATGGTMPMPLSTFERCWKRAKYWALVLSSPGVIPATAEPNKYLRSVLSLERWGLFLQAEKGYRAAISRWPGQSQFPVALANVLAQQNRKKEAAEVLARALAGGHDSPAAMNNYAQLLLALGRQAEALPVAEKAALMPGPFQAAAERTLAEVKESLAKLAPR